MRDHTHLDAFADAATPTLAAPFAGLALVVALVLGLWAVSEPAVGALLFGAAATAVSVRRHL